MLQKTALAVSMSALMLISGASFANDNVANDKAKIDSQKSYNIDDIRLVRTPTVYDISMTVLNFELNEKISLADNLLNIDNELKTENNIDKVFERYGNILSADTYMTNTVEGAQTQSAHTQSIKYIDKVVDGVISKKNLEVTNWKNFYTSIREDDQTVRVYIDVKSESLDSLTQYKASENKKDAVVEGPNVSISRIQQNVVVKPGEYKLVNLGSVVEKGQKNKIYQAVIIKLTEKSY